MPQVPFHLQYTLNRRQRLVPHLAIWGPFSLIAPAGMVGAVFISPWWALAIPVVLWMFRGLFVGLVDVIVHPVREMDIVVEENALGVFARGDRWYLFLDGILEIRKHRKDVWTIEHYNECVVNVLASAISEDQLNYLKAAAERGRTPEGIQAVIERGRRIEKLLNEPGRHDGPEPAQDAR